MLDTPDLAALGPGSRPARWAATTLNGRLDELFAASGFVQARQRPIRSLLLLWHDHLDASHQISQDIHNADGSYLHGIMHRREPDFSNAKYWFNRVGKHTAFPILAERVERLENGLLKIEGIIVSPRPGQWDPIAFVDACQRVLAGGDRAKIQRMEGIQQLEFQVLLERFCGGEGLP